MHNCVTDETMRPDILAIIDTQRLEHNLAALRALCRPGVRICAPLKADAYGHGVEIIAPALQAAGADFAAVATIHEAVHLRDLGWGPPILVLGNPLAIADPTERAERIAAIVRHNLTVTVADPTAIGALRAADSHEPIQVHLKIDTGMGRMGIMPQDADRVACTIRDATHLRLTGIFSHFATSDFAEPDLAKRQLDTFNDVLARIGDALPPGIIRHMANSAAVMTLPESHFDMVRPGLALFGYPPAPHLADRIDVRPVLRLISHLCAVKELPARHCVGYGETVTTRRPTRLGIVPVGYFDGYVRALSNNAVVSTPVGDAPVIGRVSMDQLAIDITDLPAIGLGTEVGLIDDDSTRPNSVVAIANRLATIPYEVTCLLGPRISRVRAEPVARRQTG